MAKAIRDILAPRAKARPRIYAYADAASGKRQRRGPTPAQGNALGNRPPTANQP